MNSESRDQSRRFRGRSHMGLEEALGQSERFLEFQEKLSRVAPIDRPVLLIGERGTGKELAAARLHFLSPRWQGPLVALNCSALAPTLIESELFGYERGAFTGAERRRAGRFETADRGTLFLDEIGSIPMEVQEKILRVVEYGTFEPVGSSQSIEVDVRIIAATNADLTDLAERDRFKRDLLDRLCFEALILPPLREREGDILFLANHFAGRMALELGRKEVPRFDKDAVKALEGYSWPGNIRELKNVVERAVYRSDSSHITKVVFDPLKTSQAKPPPPAKEVSETKSEEVFLEDLWDKPLKEAIRELRIRLLQKRLIETKYNQRKAARLLGLTYDQFRGLYRKYRKVLE
jgi:psp operon transcriptional activator